MYHSDVLQELIKPFLMEILSLQKAKCLTHSILGDDICSESPIGGAERQRLVGNFEVLDPLAEFLNRFLDHVFFEVENRAAREI